MPKVDPLELLNDRDKYPDDLEITLSNGDTISVKEYRDKALPKDYFSRQQQSWQARERALQDEGRTAQQNLARAVQERQALEARIAELSGRPAAPAPGSEVEDELRRDPAFGPLFRRLDKQEELINKLAEDSKRKDARLEQHERTWQTKEFTGTLAKLKAADPDLDFDAFHKYLQTKPVIDVEMQTPDIEATYRNFAHDRIVAKAVKEAEQRGIEKGRADAKVPRIPYGRGRSLPTKPDNLPASFQDVTDEMVAQDDEVMAPLMGPEA